MKEITKESMREIRVTLGWALILLSCIWYVLLTFAVPDLQESMLGFGFSKVDEYQIRLVPVVMILAVIALTMNENLGLKLGVFEFLGALISTALLMTFLMFVHSFAVFLFLVLGMILIVLLKFFAKSAVSVAVGLYIGMYGIFSLIWFVFLELSVKSLFEVLHLLMIFVSTGIVFTVFELPYGMGVKDKQRLTQSKKCTDILAACCFGTVLVLYLQARTQNLDEFFFTKPLLTWLCSRFFYIVIILYTKRYKRKQQILLMQSTKDNALCKL